jgi:hypothetical protein
LSKIRRLFSTETVAFVQRRRRERRTSELLFEPESLQQLGPQHRSCFTPLVNYKHLVPDKVKSLAREIIRR